MYSNIVNPINGNIVKVDSLQGQNILKNYINLLNELSIKQRGGASASKTATEQVIIPHGVSAGDKFIVVLSDHSQIRLTCPDDKEGGDRILLTPEDKIRLQAETLAVGEPESSEEGVAGGVMSAEYDPEKLFICPITQGIMYDPVINALGYTYEREDIENWWSVRVARGEETTDPLTGQVMSDLTLRPNMFARNLTEQWCQYREFTGDDDDCKSYLKKAVAIREKNAKAATAAAFKYNIIYR